MGRPVGLNWPGENVPESCTCRTPNLLHLQRALQGSERDRQITQWHGSLGFSKPGVGGIVVVFFVCPTQAFGMLRSSWGDCRLPAQQYRHGVLAT